MDDTILSRLDASTRRFHATVDAPWLDLLDADIATSDYLSVLVRMYGLVAPFESACKYTPGLSRLVDFRQLMRAGFIAQDLLALDLSPGQVASIPTCPSITMFRSVLEAIGWLYVMERATSRQDQIRRRLIRHGAPLAQACTYLSSFDEHTGDRWSALGRVLDRGATDAAAEQEITRAAVDAFETATHWLTHAKTELRSVG